MRNAGWGVLALMAVALGGCGDGETSDRRGYTKAPLETPGVFIEAERQTDVSRIGVPNRPSGDTLTATPAEPAGN